MMLRGGSGLGTAPMAYAQPPRDLYTRALAQDRAVRDARQTPTLRQIRAAVAAYERVVRRYPASGYADNALWQGGELSRLAWERFGDDADRRTGVRLLKQLQSGYPSSSLLLWRRTGAGTLRGGQGGSDVRTAPAASAAPPPSTSVPAPVTRPVTKPAEDSRAGPRRHRDGPRHHAHSPA